MPINTLLGFGSRSRTPSCKLRLRGAELDSLVSILAPSCVNRSIQARALRTPKSYHWENIYPGSTGPGLEETRPNIANHGD